MQEQAWDMLLRRIPAPYHDGLIVATVSGAEIVMQSIVRAEECFLIVRGRTAGTSDNGKVIIIPFSQINFISFPRALNEGEIQGIFGDRDVQIAAAPEMSPAGQAEETPPGEEEHTPPPAKGTALPAVPGQENHPPQGPGKVSKSLLLAKLRARLAGDAANGSKK